MDEHLKIQKLLKEISDKSEGKQKPSYVEVVAELLKGKAVEIFLGDEYEELNQNDFNVKVQTVLCGFLVGALGDCLLVDCIYADAKDKTIKHGNIIMVNGYAIKAITELDGDGTLNHAFTAVNVSHKIAAILNRIK